MATAVIGALRVDLGMSTANFSSGIAKAQGGLKGLSASADIFSRQFVKSFASAALGAVSLGAAIRSTRMALDQFGNIADKSAAAGIDSEFFQGIAAQAKLAGVDINAVADALATFNKNSGLAVDQRGKLYTTLKAINPELLEGIRLATSQEQRIRLVADAIAKAKSGAEQAAIASAAWGDQGVRLVSLFSQGADALDRQIQSLKDMGIIVDRDLIASADELGDKWDLASQVIDTKLKSSLVSLAPIMVDLVSLAAQFANYMGQQYAGVKPMNIPSWGKGGVGTQMNQHLADLLRGLAYPETAVSGLPRRYSEGQYMFGDMGSFFAPFQATAAKDAIGANWGTWAQLGGGMKGAGGAGGSGTTVPTIKIDTTAATNAIEAMDLGLDDFNATMERTSHLGETVADGLASTFANMTSAIFAGKSGLDAFSDGLKNIANQLVNSALQGLFRAAIGGLTGGIGGGSFVGAGFGAYGSFDGGGFTGYGARTGGLDGKGGFMAMLHPNETVLDHTKGQGGPMISISITGSRQDAAEIARLVEPVIDRKLRQYQRNPDR